MAALSANRPGEAELIELLGPVGEYPAELEAYQRHFGIKPCRYPPQEQWHLKGMATTGGASDGAAPLPPCEDDRLDCTHLHCMSVDNASTRDIDDAISIEVGDASSPQTVQDGCVTLGIHIADVAAHIVCGSTLFDWAFQRASSAYHRGIVGDYVATAADGTVSGQGAARESHDFTAEGSDRKSLEAIDPSLRGGSVPMLPPDLAHGTLSLNEGVARNALSLFLVIKEGRVVKK